ncbi:ATP-binding protein [Micromonospora sp. DT201]|uniref:ATP-binding protein n=1 Tax=Micromonospora sp. DT201 TaxID=3393442 RepID=UPI003CF0850B
MEQGNVAKSASVVVLPAGGQLLSDTVAAEERHEAPGRLRFAPEILARLGEELIPHADLGIVELVRNCYDAGAPSCTVTLNQVEVVGGSVTITDNGDGMSREELDAGFLLIGRSRKLSDPITGNNRRKIGEKGLGRLAGLRLGHRVEVRTRPRGERGVEHRLSIDWDAYDTAASVDTVELPLVTVATSAEPGTTITVKYLRKPLTHADVTRLVRALFLINDPFGAQAGGFIVKLVAPGFEEQATRLTHGYFDQAEYRIEATLDENGRAQAQVFDWRGVETSTFAHDEIASDRDYRHFAAPACRFRLWVVPLGGESYRQRGATVPISELRGWLQQVGGVHLYHRGLRVHPYGDQGHDWLDMNLSRSGSPEGRPSTNNSIGIVEVFGDDDLLIQKTDRSGFVENESFDELREFGKSVLARVARDRVRRRDAAREKKRDQTKQAMDRSKKEFKKELERLPEADRRPIEEKAEAWQKTQEDRVRLLEQDLALYRTLGTVGTTAAVFAHESLMPVQNLKMQAELIEMQTRATFASDYEDRVGRSLDRIRSAADSLHVSAQIPLRLAKRSKRQAGTISIHETVAELVSTILPRLQGRHISLEQHFEAVDDAVVTTIASIEAILVNLLVNATKELSGEDGPPPSERKIVVRTSNGPNRILVEVMDNGPGIRNIGVADIWLPGLSTHDDGTGLGLTIVRDVVSDLKGKAEVVPSGELGGAHFTISLPLAAAGRTAPKTPRQQSPSGQEQLL